MNQNNINSGVNRIKPDILYHGTDIPDILELEPRKINTPGGEKNAPKRVYATELPGFAAAHSFRWKSKEGFRLYSHNGIRLEVPLKFKDRLNIKVYIHILSSEQFELTQSERTGHTYDTEASVKPIETMTFGSVQEAIEFFGGKVIYYQDGILSDLKRYTQKVLKKILSN